MNESYCATLIRLDSWLLPGGRQEIQVVDPDLMRAITEHLKSKMNLVVSVISHGHAMPCYKIASECKVVDFFQLEDSTFSVVLEGIQRVKVIAVQHHLGAYQVTVNPLPNWPSQPISEDSEILAEALLEFYSANPEISGLYSHIHLEDLNWVSQRWLEVLPMYNQDKQVLLKEPDCHKAAYFMKHLIEGGLSAEGSAPSLD
ncbi:MAG: LON peptidase substrate-binding domain-containing protein [Shewanellaceae bacterium]|nr:LON peptidase substrate-binding domain-containing protein [Shewanellaceae bacterium]